MWPFTRKLPQVYIIENYLSGESRRTFPVHTLSNGDRVVRKHGDDALVLEQDGKITGQTARWEAIDELPGLTDGRVTPADEIKYLEIRVRDLNDHLERVIEAAEALRDAKTGHALKKAEGELLAVVGQAEIDMDRG